jgi:general stress protein YciG
MTREEAGRKGGEKVAQEKGPEFYSEIGRKGGEKVARERGSEFYSEIGRKGGKKRQKKKDPSFTSEIDEKAAKPTHEPRAQVRAEKSVVHGVRRQKQRNGKSSSLLAVSFLSYLVKQYLSQ